MNQLRMVWICLAVAAPASFVEANPIPESERWATITHPGNEAFPANFGGLVIPLGRVDHEYQISRTETTMAEWLEFVQAQAPFLNPSEAISISFTTQYINRSPTTGEYSVLPGFENRPIEGTWRYGARMCNWLHNDKAMTAEAFESGAYDVSTFGEVPGGFTDQIAHSPGARYWLPTHDELVKASHFDPNRHGPNQPGYWMYPHSSDVAPIQGAPGIGETNGGTGLFLDVSSYENVQSPWGLWDASGGIGEWTETVPNLVSGELPTGRIFEGSVWNEPGVDDDRINFASASFPSSIGRAGFRIARAVPSPSGALVFFGAVYPFTQRRRPAHDASFAHHCLGGSRPRRALRVR